MTFPKASSWVICILVFCTLTTANANSQARNGEHEVRSAIPDGFKYIPLPSGPHLAVAFFARNAESQFPYEAQIIVILDKASKQVAIDTEYNIKKNLYEKECNAIQEVLLSHGTQNNYPYSEWMLTCNVGSTVGKPKFSVIKSVVGETSVYYYQYEIQSNPLTEQVEAIKKYLDAQSLCDDTSIFHSCQAVPK